MILDRLGARGFLNSIDDASRNNDDDDDDDDGSRWVLRHMIEKQYQIVQ
jgi:hypothetical protein